MVVVAEVVAEVVEVDVGVVVEDVVGDVVTVDVTLVVGLVVDEVVPRAVRISDGESTCEHRCIKYELTKLEMSTRTHHMRRMCTYSCRACKVVTLYQSVGTV